MTLSVWHNGYDWIIAESAEDALRVEAEHHGGGPDDFDGDSWTQLPDDKPITVVFVDEEPEVRAGGAAFDLQRKPRRTLTAAEWCVSEGRSFLASTEY